jgi:hypothetical protein
MTARVQTGRDQNADGAPYASVSYGPLLFALPLPEAGDPNTPVPAAQWNYALDPQAPGLSVERGVMPERWDWPLAAPLQLRAHAVETTWPLDPKAPRLPPGSCPGQGLSREITLVPYGCTKFRVSMFPVAEREGR